MRLDHTIIPVKDKEASAKFFARIMGLDFQGIRGSQGFVRVNEAMMLRFDEKPRNHEHYGFHVSEDEFDAVVERLSADDMTYGNSPTQQDNVVGSLDGGRRIFFTDPDGHSIELITAASPDINAS
jgi:catechol 2,3-dioxygenase-like lactoylglutathione lyase family enzyme